MSKGRLFFVLNFKFYFQATDYEAKACQDICSKINLIFTVPPKCAVHQGCKASYFISAGLMVLEEQEIKDPEPLGFNNHWQIEE